MRLKVDMELARRSLLVWIGTVVMATWLGSVALFTWFLIWVWPAVVGVVVGLIFLTATIGARPRLPKLPTDHTQVDRAMCPQLFALADTIADEMEAPQVKVLAFDSSVNASTLRIGLRRQLAIVIGFPLWEALTPAERVALLSHEVAHEVSGDLWRSPLIGTSIGVLARWHSYTWPGSFEAASQRGFAEAFGWILIALPHVFLDLIVRFQHRLSLADHRRSEFTADRKSTAVAGTRALLTLMERLVLVSSIDYAMRQTARQGMDHDSGLWANIRQRFVDLPEADRTAIRRSAMAEETSADATHPPTAERIAAIEALAFHQPLVWLDRAQNAAIDRELDHARALIEPIALREARRSLDHWP